MEKTKRKIRLLMSPEEYEALPNKTNLNPEWTEWHGVKGVYVDAEVDEEEYRRVNIKLTINQLYFLADEVCVERIAPFIEKEKLWNWCGAWREAIYDILNDLEREVLDERD